ncbi:MULTISPECIES: hypothetical protein [Actinomadura]|uniref:Uncharacterized protein n=1 Tax=Actinomadura yumaensis TaxID=111807 RepID=A0ABW2CJS0_9ACTN|nr:hypothetical protein [Actinomadura sp. J1-007]MWK38785.1 hypothetical protein [Actinomadura sp. J1-007]
MGGVVDFHGGHVRVDTGNDGLLSSCARADGRPVPFCFGDPHRDASLCRERAERFRGLESAKAAVARPDPDRLVGRSCR